MRRRVSGRGRLRRRWARGAALAAVALALLGAPACGSGQTRGNLFSTGSRRDDGGSAIAAVRARLRGTRPPPGADVVVGVAGNADKLVGLPLAGGWKWTFAHPLDSRPIVAGGLVLGAGGREVFALDAITGQKIWARDTGGLPLRGAGDDGNVTVLSLARGAHGESSTLLAIDRFGGVERQLETDEELGAPAVVGGYAFVPWAGQYVSVIDPIGGDEPARIVLREQTSRAWTVGGGLYFGELGIFRFDERIAAAAAGRGSHLALPRRGLPGDPVLFPSSAAPGATTASARDRVRLYARPSTPEGPLAFDGDRFYATYFRLVMGFHANPGGGDGDRLPPMAWLYANAHDVLGASAGAGELVICDEQGRILVFDGRNGTLVAERDLDEALASCVVQIDGFRAPTNGFPEAPPLAEQVADALARKDRELAGADVLLVRELARLDDDVATTALIDRAMDSGAPPEVQREVRAAIASRRTGGPLLLAALAAHYDYLRDIDVPPPVGPIARALASLHERAAAPLLAAHLLDPASADDDVRDVATALVDLAGAPELPALKQFFALHRASAESDAIVAAVVAAGAGIVRAGGREGRAMIEWAAHDPLTRAEVRDGLAALLTTAGE